MDAAISAEGYHHLVQAVVSARLALKAEEESKLMDAQTHYGDACRHMSFVVEFVTGKQRDTLSEKMAAYQTRMNVLASFGYSSRPGGTAARTASDGSDKAQEFFELHTMEFVPCPRPFPDDSRRRPYAIMKMFSQTLKVGSYITPTIFVPPEVWFQTAIKIPAIGSKHHCCDTVVDQLIKMQGEDVTNAATFATELEYFANALPPIQDQLARSLTCIPPITDTNKTFLKSVTQSFSRAVSSNKMDDPSQYLNLLLQLLDNGLFIERLYEEFEHKEGEKETRIVELCDTISEFFERVICAFVFDDCVMLTLRYMQEQCTQLQM